MNKTPFESMMDPNPEAIPETISEESQGEDSGQFSPSNEETGADHFADFETDFDGVEPGQASSTGGAAMPAGPMSPEELAGLAQVFGQLIGMVSGVVTARFEVAALSVDELDGLAVCSANVAQFYVGNPTPLQAAWIGLGLVSVGIVTPRASEVRARKAAALDAAPVPKKNEEGEAVAAE